MKRLRLTLLLGDVLVLSSAETTFSTLPSIPPPEQQPTQPSSASSLLIDMGSGDGGKRKEKSRAAEIVVGDETGSVVLTAQNGDQIDTILALGSAGHPFTVKNAYTELTAGENCLRLLVDTFFGEITPWQSNSDDDNNNNNNSSGGSQLLSLTISPSPSSPPSHLNTQNNLSKIRYEKVN